jgi:hypothetical protein
MFPFSFDIAWLKSSLTHSLLLNDDIHETHEMFLMAATGKRNL